MTPVPSGPNSVPGMVSGCQVPLPKEVLRRRRTALLVDVPPVSSHLGTCAREVGSGRRERRLDAP